MGIWVGIWVYLAQDFHSHFVFAAASNGRVYRGSSSEG